MSASRFERLIARVQRRTEARAAERRREIARLVAEAAPEGVAVSVEGEAVVLEARGLARRFLLEPALRWLEVRGGR